MVIKLNAAQIEHLTNVDLKNNWVDVHQEKSGEIKLDIWAKNWFKDGICRIISFISFGKLLNRKAAIDRVTSAVMTSQSQLFTNQFQKDIKGRYVQKLSSEKQLKFALKQIKVQEQSSAAIMYSNREDLEKVLRTYKEYLDEDSKKAEEFIKGTDVEGNTLLHLYAKMKNNIQKPGVLGLLGTLGKDHFESLLLTRNKKQETPVSLALERGQMGLISVIYPIAGQSIFSEIDGQGGVYLPRFVKDEDITSLILKLSNPDDLDKLLKECPGPNAFDNVNHIMDALFRLALYGYGHDIAKGIQRADHDDDGGQEINQLLPQELLWLNFFMANNQWKVIFERLRGECEAITTPEGVVQKMDEWQYEPLKREPEKYISLPKELLENQDDPLTHLVIKALQTEDEAQRNAYYNHVVALINPFVGYDLQIDFSSQKSLQVLHNLVNFVFDNPAVLEDAKSFIKMLILKNPDFLTAKNESGDTITDALEKIKDPSPSAQALLDHIIDIQKSLYQTLFENRVKKSLKYYLEDKGRDFIPE